MSTDSRSWLKDKRIKYIFFKKIFSTILLRIKHGHDFVTINSWADFPSNQIFTNSKKKNNFKECEALRRRNFEVREFPFSFITFNSIWSDDWFKTSSSHPWPIIKINPRCLKLVLIELRWMISTRKNERKIFPHFRLPHRHLSKFYFRKKKNFFGYISKIVTDCFWELAFAL